VLEKRGAFRMTRDELELILSRYPVPALLALNLLRAYNAG
jgi:hypothetical protein